MSTYHQKYKAEHKEEINAYMKDYMITYREKNLDKLQKQAKDRYNTDIEKRRKRGRDFYHKHKQLRIWDFCPACGLKMRKPVYFVNGDREIMVHKGKCKHKLAQMIAEGMYI